jgi:hypothetical protein
MNSAIHNLASNEMVTNTLQWEIYPPLVSFWKILPRFDSRIGQAFTQATKP